MERWEVAPRSAREAARPDRETVLEARLVRDFPQGRWDTMIGSRSDLITRLTRGSKRREFGRVGEIHSMGGGVWFVHVWRIREEPARWRKPAIVAGSVLAVLGTIAGLGWLAASAATDALAGKGDAVLAAFVLIGAGLVALVFRRPIVEVLVRVR